MQKKVKIRLSSLPKKSGIYIMKDVDSKILYIGKAKDLSKRVKNYFQKNDLDVKTKRMTEKVCDIDWVVTESELEALMLETSMIKKHKPRYNILMKDDKNYVYLKITKESFPRVILVRKIEKDGSRYFGPYTNAWSVKQSMRAMNRIFPFFTYRDKSGIAPMNSQAGKELFYKRMQTAWGDLASEEAYKLMINDFADFWRGKTGGVKEFLKDAMEKTALKKDYEKAAAYRDRIKEIEYLTDKQKIVIPRDVSFDVVSIGKDKNEMIVVLIEVRSGKVWGIKKFLLDNKIEQNESEGLKRWLLDYYSIATEVPREICVNVENDNNLLEEYLANLAGHKVEINLPKIGYKKNVMQMAEENVVEEIGRNKIDKLANLRQSKALELFLYELQKSDWQVGKKLWDKWKSKYSFRIEAYDISNLGDDGLVGAMIVWGCDKKTNGFIKNSYRRFKMKDVQSQNDFASLEEMFTRRWSKPKEDLIWPDLVIVDGGKGQLSVCSKVMSDKKIEVAIVSLAKENELIIAQKEIVDGNAEYLEIGIDRLSPASLLVQMIRDEVHRYVLAYQKIERKKVIQKSVLNDVIGLGPKKRKSLLREMGSLKNIRNASVDDLEKIVGKVLAEKIKEIV